MPSSPQPCSDWPEFPSGSFASPSDPVSVNSLASAVGKLKTNSREASLLKQLDVLVEIAPSLDELLVEVAAIIQQHSDCQGLWLVTREANSNEFKVRPFFDSSVSLEQEDLLRWSASPGVNLYSQSGDLGFAAFDLPNELNDEPLALLVGAFQLSRASKLRIEWLLGLIRAAVQRWSNNRRLALVQQRNRSLTDMFAVVDRLNRTDSVAESAKVIVNQIQRLSGASLVAVAIGGEPSDLQLAAISGVEQIDDRSDAARVLLSACRQPLLKQSTQVFSKTGFGDSESSLVFQQLCNSYQQQCGLAVPLQTSGDGYLGAVVVCQSQQATLDDALVSYLEGLCEMLAGYLAMVLKAHETPAAKCCSDVTSRTIAAIAGLLLMAMLIPVPYRMNCECELQPVSRRFIAAPYEGILQQSLVETGELVAAGQVIARLDGRQIRMELAGVEAELEGARKRRDLALAQGNIAQSQIAKSELLRFEAERNLLMQRLENLDIRSPIDGWVVVGDLDKAQGAAVELGQTLFEIAPLEKMVAEVEVPEDEIRFVASGMPADLKLNSFPFRSFAGNVSKVNLRAEVRDEESVFVAEVQIDNADRLLKPGMAGRAKIDTGWSTLGWRLFHRPWESVRCWSVW